MASHASSSSSSQVPISERPPGITQLNDSVWELYNPFSIVTVPKVEIIFFHGLQFEDYKQAFWRTWLSRDNTVVWPKDWLSERFSTARILSISYDSLAWKHEGEQDLYVITENLIQDMIQADKVRVGQNCPVVLVGHSVGGIVIKQFVLGCIRMKEELNSERSQLQVNRIKMFLGNCRGVFYYSTPHLGSRVADYADLIAGIKWNVPLMNLLKTLSRETGRINESFASARSNFGIRTSAIGESLKTDYKGEAMQWSSAMIVEEASARNDIDGILYTAPDANHFDVCKPKDNTTCGIFKHLVTFVADMLERDQTTVAGEDGDERQGLPNYPIELDSRARDIEKLLTGKAVMGISGMGGIGKTTLAKKVYNNISRQFEYTCFAENVKNKQMDDLEDWLLCHVHERGTRMEGARREWRDLNGKKTMILLDDVDSVRQLEVLPTLPSLGKGSCIILTSRDQNIFKFYPDYELYQVEFLKVDEAKKLFCQHAFGTEDTPGYPTEMNHLKEHVDVVVKRCNGLPLTLEVMGRYLRNKMDAKVWEETIDKLRRAESIDGKRKDRVWASLSVSYEALVKEEQDMFVEASTYFFGQPLDEALAAWSSISAHSKSRWENLVSRSMVKENQDKTVWVHEQLRDLAWTLTKDEVALGSNQEETDKLVDQLNSEQLNAVTKILKLKSSSDSHRILQLKCAAKLKELKYLDLDKVHIKGSGKNLPRTLSLLRWKAKLGLESTSSIPLGSMITLVVLELGNLFTSNEFLDSLANLTNLRHLSLWRLNGLSHLPENFGNLSHLKYLNLDDLRLRSLPESFGALSALEHLTLRALDVSELPESFKKLSKLVKLTIYSCQYLSSLPSFVQRPTSLKELRITWCPLLKCLPDSFSLLSTLRQLDLEYCSGLKNLGASFENLSALEDLNLSCTGLEKLPHSFSQLSGLRRLSLSRCESLKELGNSFGSLCTLKYLDLDGTGIGGLPESFGEGNSALEELTCDFDQAQFLPEKFYLLTSLRVLFIKSESLERLPESLGELSRLEKLHIKVNNVDALPKSLGKLASLRNLDICSEKLENLPDSLGMLSSLETLRIVARKLESLPESIGQLHSLRTIELDVASIRYLPGSIFQLPSLREISFNCDGHDRMPDLFYDRPFPRSLSLVLKGESTVPRGIGRLVSLQDLTLEFMYVRNLPRELGELWSLQRLTISLCTILERLPDSVGRLSSLRELHLINCYRLNSLPDSLGRLSLRKWQVICCDSLMSLPDSLGRDPSSRVLRFSSRDSLGNLHPWLIRPSSSQVASRRIEGFPESLRNPTSSQVPLRRVRSFPTSYGRPASSEAKPEHGNRQRGESPREITECQEPYLPPAPSHSPPLRPLCPRPRYPRKLQVICCHSLMSLPDCLGRDPSAGNASSPVSPQYRLTHHRRGQSSIPESEITSNLIIELDSSFLARAFMRGRSDLEAAYGSDVEAEFHRYRRAVLRRILWHVYVLCYFFVGGSIALGFLIHRYR